MTLRRQLNGKSSISIGQVTMYADCLQEILYPCFRIHFVCPTAGWRREMRIRQETGLPIDDLVAIQERHLECQESLTRRMDTVRLLALVLSGIAALLCTLLSAYVVFSGWFASSLPGGRVCFLLACVAVSAWVVAVVLMLLLHH